jgi:23S rRNA (adenine-N6)-dimethyltransferase
MYYKPRRQAFLSQNFLRDPELVDKLIRNTSIGKNDTVLEIGPGRGIITTRLLKFSKKVIAIELDKNLLLRLREKLRPVNNLELIHSDFLTFELPSSPYKVFANIPFFITADVIRKLTESDNFREGYLVVQKEAAQKFSGMPYDNKNQMMSILLKPWFDISIIHNFSRTDFYPISNVDSTMIRIIRLKNPVIDQKYKTLYRNFVLYKFNKSKVSRMRFKDFVNLFWQFIKRDNSKEINEMNSEASKILQSQKYLSKIHRSRTDKYWRRKSSYYVML